MNYQFKIIKQRNSIARYFVYLSALVDNGDITKLIGIGLLDNEDKIDFFMIDDINNIEVVMDQPYPNWYYIVLFQQLFSVAEWQQPIDNLIKSFIESYL